MRNDIVSGARFTDYELTDHTATPRKLSELQGTDPKIVVLSPGGFCPKDRRQAEGLIQLHREMEVGYCRLVTISTDSLTETNEYRSGVGAHWPFPSDAGRVVQKDLDIAEYTDPVHNPMIPHVVVLEPDLIIHKIYSGYWFLTSAAWMSKPSWQIRPLLDPVIPVEEFKFEAERAHSHVIELNSSHAIPITYQDVVVDVIEQAARALAK
jgi:peroxiredoxin